MKLYVIRYYDKNNDYFEKRMRGFKKANKLFLKMDNSHDYNNVELWEITLPKRIKK